jgi:hypothetical protein
MMLLQQVLAYRGQFESLPRTPSQTQIHFDVGRGAHIKNRLNIAKVQIEVKVVAEVPVSSYEIDGYIG